MRTVMLPIVLLVSLLMPGRQSGAEREDWIQLFNGKNLDGWVPKITGYPLGENYADTFRVVNGALQASYDKYTRFDSKFGHLFYQRQKFSHYRSSLSTGSSANRSPAGRTGPSATTA